MVFVNTDLMAGSYTAAQHWRDFDLNLRVIGADDQFGNRLLALERARVYMCPGNGPLNSLRDPAHGCTDLLKGRCSVGNGHVGQIKIDGETGHVA